MKIAIFTDTFYPKIDGVVSATLNLAKGLADRGNKVFIICPANNNLKEEFKHKNIEIIRFRGIPALFYPEFKLTTIFNYDLYKTLKKEKIDIIHFQTPLTLGYQAILMSRLLKVPLVGTFHTFFGDPNYLKHIKFNNRLGVKMSWNLSRFFYNKCDLITCPSESTKNELIHNQHYKPIKVISNGIDFNAFKSQRSLEVQKRHKSGPLILFIGRISHEKNIDYLIDCFSFVVKKSKNAKLILIGDGPQMQEVRKRVLELNLADNIILQGKMDHEDLIRSSIFKESDIFVSASVTENQPMTVLEAQVNGLPCVVIGERGMKDLIINNYNGYLVQNNDKEKFAEAILNLVNNKTLLKRFHKNTLLEIKKHDLSNVIDIWINEYDSLIKKYQSNSQKMIL